MRWEYWVIIVLALWVAVAICAAESAHRTARAWEESARDWREKCLHLLRKGLRP